VGLAALQIPHKYNGFRIPMRRLDVLPRAA
jgi:hypothetical protein